MAAVAVAVAVGLVMEMVVVMVAVGGVGARGEEGRQTLISIPPLVGLVLDEIMVCQHFVVFSADQSFLTHSPLGSSSFTMRDEVWSTENHRNHWSSSARPLRHGGMNFIAAGPMDPLILVESSPNSQERKKELPKGNLPAANGKERQAGATVAMLQSNYEVQVESVCNVEPASTSITQKVNINVTMPGEIGIDKSEANTSIQATAAEPAEDIPFVMDVSLTKPSLGLNLSMVAHVPSAPPSPLLDSSGEEIVFVPKSQRRARSISQSSVTLSKKISRDRIEESPPKDPTPPWKDDLLSTGCSVTVIEDSIDVTVTKPVPSITVPISKSKRRKEIKKAKKEKKARKYSQEMSDDIDDEVVADYIENTNLEELGDFVTGAGSRDIGGKDMEFLFSASEDDSDDDYSDNDDFDDDQLLRDKKAQEEADFKFAQIFARLEDDDDSHDHLDDEAHEGDDDFNDFVVHKESGQMSMSIRPRNGKFPSATRMANALANEWDPMDWATPHNVIPKKNGKKGKTAKNTQWDLSDDELKAQLHLQWEKDRKVKKGKKAEQELSRKEGLTGMSEKPGQNAKKAKHLDGMNMHQLRKEITEFLCNDDFPYLALPPMSKAARKAVHNIAHVLSLESQSRGAGKNRFPMLYKTSATSPFLGKRELIAQQLTLAETRAMPFSKAQKKARKFVGEVSRVSPRDGDTVGGTAPEIGRENKGRMMLEKMGYKPGMALGVEGNKGITAPIVAVVKRTRTGLG